MEDNKIKGWMRKNMIALPFGQVHVCSFQEQ